MSHRNGSAFVVGLKKRVLMVFSDYVSWPFKCEIKHNYFNKLISQVPCQCLDTASLFILSDCELWVFAHRFRKDTRSRRWNVLQMKEVIFQKCPISRKLKQKRKKKVFRCWKSFLTQFRLSFNRKSNKIRFEMEIECRPPLGLTVLISDFVRLWDLGSEFRILVLMAKRVNEISF